MAFHDVSTPCEQPSACGRAMLHSVPVRFRQREQRRAALRPAWSVQGSRSLLEYSEFQLERAKELNSYAKVSALNAELRAKHTLEVSTLVHKQQALAWPSHISTPHSLIPSDAGFQGMEGL